MVTIFNYEIDLIEFAVMFSALFVILFFVIQEWMKWWEARK